MKKKVPYHQSSEYAQQLFFGFKPVSSADDILDNLERFIRGNFSLRQRADILLTVHNTAGSNQLEEWRRKEKKWIKESPYPELTKAVLTMFLEYHMNSNIDESNDWLELDWEGRIEPLANEAIEPFLQKTNSKVVESKG